MIFGRKNSKIIEGSTDLLRYAAVPERFQAGHNIRVLNSGGETYPAMLEAIASAQKDILFETYILAEDKIGHRFIDALAEKAKEGVAVRLIFDGFGSMGLSDSFLSKISAANILYREFHPILPWRRRFRLNNRDHRKILVVDSLVGFCGGLNIAKDYASKDDGGVGWHDIHARVEGPAVLELARLFAQTWDASDGRSFEIPERYVPQKGHNGNSLARIVSNRLFHKRFLFRRAYIRAIHSAIDTVYIMNAYFIPSLMMRRALMKAAARGVDVKVIVPANTDVKVVRKASQYLYTRLLKKGISIHEWRGPMMHAKTCVIDKAWGLVGSYNLDNQSLRKNLEVALVLVDRVVASEMNSLFSKELENSDSIMLEQWKKRSWWKKFGEWFAFQFQRWL